MFLGREERLVSNCEASGVGFSFLGPETKCYLLLIVWGWEDNIKRNLKETKNFLQYMDSNFFKVLLTVHLSIILVINHLNAQILVL